MSFCCSPHPSILGFGGPLFDGYEVPIDLDLIEQRSFGSGVTMHRYAIRQRGEAVTSESGGHQSARVGAR